MKFPMFFTDEYFKNESRAEISQKVEALIRAMTWEEKADLCHGGANPPFPGQVANGGYIKGVPRLGVPEIRMFDGPAGVTSVYETTGLPAEEMLASTWSRRLAYAFGDITGSENRMISGNCQLGAEVDLVRTTHFNRTRDMLGEDPFLTSELAVPLVKGIQSHHVMAVLKHFAGYVVSANPANSSNTVFDEQTLHELYLAPFEQAIHRAGAAGIMTAYNRINGTYAAASAELLWHILREQWDFKAMAMCDWGGNHSFSLPCGLDVEMPLGAYNSTQRILRFLDSGRLTENELNRAAAHVLYALGSCGYLSLVRLNEDLSVQEEAGRTEPIRMPDTYAEHTSLLASHAETAEEIALKGTVLLKNREQTLPIRQGERTALIGLGAVHPICGYGQERAYGTLRYMRSPAAAFRSIVGDTADVKTCVGIDHVGSCIPTSCLFTEKDGTFHGLKRFYGISEPDGYRPPLMSMGGEGEEFKGIAMAEESGDDEALHFAPADLFMPCSDAADMQGFETGVLYGIDPVLEFTCGKTDVSYRNGPDGTAFRKGEAYTWKGYLEAPESGTYLLNLHAIGGIAVFQMNIDGRGMKDLGCTRLREGSQWPWGNLICTPEGMEISATEVTLEQGVRYPIMVYGKAMLTEKDLQLRLAWVTPSMREANRAQALEAAVSADKTVLFIHSGFKLNKGTFAGGLSFAEHIDLELDPEQKEFLMQVAATSHRHGGRLIVVAYNGSAFAMKSWIDCADALLYQWMPGQGGGSALAKLLTGVESPGGKLPQSFPDVNENTLISDTQEHPARRWYGIDSGCGYPDIQADEGIFTGYRWYDREQRQPLFEFGFGLSYTTFEYSDLTIDRSPEVTISFHVTNTGVRVGDEIVQVYLGCGSAPEHVMCAHKQLCGFERLENLQPGETRRVQITIPKRSFMYWDAKKPLRRDPDGLLSKWELAAGNRCILVGSSASDIRLRGQVIVE